MMWMATIALAAPVTHEDRTFEDPREGAVDVRVYVPEDPGPFPLAVFLHGWLGSAWMYDTVCEAIAAEGFVVVSVDEQTGLVLETNRFADQAVAALHQADAASRVAGDPLEGLISDEPWTLLGHSMGGGTVPHVLALEPNVRTAVMFMAYEGYPSYYDELADYDGSLLLLTGDHDTTAPPALQAEWFARVGRAERALWIQTPDMGHQAVLDLSFDEDPMPDEVQRDLVVGWARDFVVAEHRGEEDRWRTLVGPGTDGLGARLESHSLRPALWAERDGSALSLGLASVPGAVATVHVDGEDAATLDLPAGVARAELEVPRTGQVTVSATISAGGQELETRTLTFGEDGAPVEEEEVDPEGTVGGETSGVRAGDEQAATAAPRGCATSPGSGAAMLATLLLARRKRR